MNITVIGTGYVGLVTGACLAELGHQVFCLDTDAQKIAALQAGQVPIHEPGLAELIERNYLAGRIIFSTDAKASVVHGEIQIIAVGTPGQADGSADLSHVFAAAHNIAQHMTQFKLIVNKSTSPVGTGKRLQQIMKETAKAEFCVAFTPEFLREGCAVQDFMQPERIVLGLNPCPNQARAKEQLTALYAPLKRPLLHMAIADAELAKYAANAMLATRISFMNEMANLADTLGADIENVRQVLAADSRIGPHFLHAGAGYGGSCFPKDLDALLHMGAQHNQAMAITQAVVRVNQAQASVLVDKITSKLGNDLSGKTLALWGLAFKPDTDDMRHAPSRLLIKELLQRGARIQAHDPVATQQAQQCLAQDLANTPALQERISYADSATQALAGADALVVITEWAQFREPDFDAIKKALKQALIFDGRNLYDPQQLQALGIEYLGIGRNTHS